MSGDYAEATTKTHKWECPHGCGESSEVNGYHQAREGVQNHLNENHQGQWPEGIEPNDVIFSI